MKKNNKYKKIKYTFFVRFQISDVTLMHIY